MLVSRKSHRFGELKKRKNFLPSLIVTIFLWFFLSMLIVFMDPDSFGAKELFFINLFLALTFTFAILLANTRRGILIASIVCIFLVLRYFGVGNLINALLLFGSAIAFEFYFSRRT